MTRVNVRDLVVGQIYISETLYGNIPKDHVMIVKKKKKYDDQYYLDLYYLKTGEYLKKVDFRTYEAWNTMFYLLD